MFKKNVIGIIIVLLVFAGFYAGYMLGKGSGNANPGMGRPQGTNQNPSQQRPASQDQGSPQEKPGTKPSGDAQWVKPQQGEDDGAAPKSPIVKTAWAEPVESPQEGAQPPDNMQQGRKQRPDMGDGAESQQRTQGQRPMPASLEEQKTPDMKIPVQKETSEKILTQEQDSALTQTFYGTVVPYAEANVQSRQGGTITLLKGKEGDYVKKGEVLVRFDERDTQLELQRAVASKNSALQQVNQAESNFRTIQSNVKRYQELFDGGFVSKQQVDDLQNQLTSAMSSLNSARESVKQNEVQVKMIENTLTDFQVRAPVGGIINEKRYNMGEIYQGSGVIYHLIDIDQVYVDVEIPEMYLKQIREGMAVSVVFDAIGDQAFSGTLETILPSGTADNRSFTAKVLVQNPDLIIKPGMFARIEYVSGGSSS